LKRLVDSQTLVAFVGIRRFVDIRALVEYCIRSLVDKYSIYEIFE
jgi:hypothetical protein